MSNQNDVLSRLGDKLAQELPDNFHVVGGLWIAIWWWISVVIRAGNLADIQSAEIGRGQLRAVRLDALRF